jgi:hypothetical protein
LNLHHFCHLHPSYQTVKSRSCPDILLTLLHQ